jgi:hypothetical protein
MKKSKNSTVRVFGAFAVLTGLIVSLPAPAQTKIRAEAVQTDSETVSETVPESTKSGYGKRHLLFEQNKGQTGKQAKFVARGTGYTLYLAETEAVFSLKYESPDTEVENPAENPKTKGQTPKTKSDSLRLKFAGAHEKATIKGETEAFTKTNYYIGKKRFENVSNYERVAYKNLYDGIDAVFYGAESNQLEYDFRLAPKADADQIKLNFDGAENLSLDEYGNLIIKTANTGIVQQKPLAYQIIDGEKREIEAKYVIDEQSAIRNPQSAISFALGEYDKSQPLTIDPALLYSTYLGGTAFDSVNDLAADAAGDAYVVGETSSLNFNGQTRASNDGTGVFVAKIDPNGSQVLYTTILEGNNDDHGNTIAVDAQGNVYIGGEATNGFPTTPGAFSTIKSPTNSDAFIAKLNPAGNSVYVTYYGGTFFDRVFDLAVDSAGKVYAVGETQSGLTFPKKNEYQGCGAGYRYNSTDGFLAVLNAAGSDIQYSTCFGGINLEDAQAVALDSSNNAYVTGFTASSGFPVKNAAQTELGGGLDSYLIKLNPTLSGDASAVFSTYIGGVGTDEGYGIDVSPGGNVYVTGVTGSVDFPLKNPIDSTNQINEAFVSEYSSTGELLNSTFLGGADQDQCDNIVVGKGENVYVIGQTLSNDFPLLSAFQTTRRGLRDVFVTKLRFGAGIISSTYFGGTGNDRGFGIALNGSSILIGGNTESNNLTTTAVAPNVPFKAAANASAANADGFVAKILDTHTDSVGVFRPSNTFILTQSTTTVLAQNAAFTTQLIGQKGVSGDWDGDGTDTIGAFTNGVWKIRNQNFPFIVVAPTFGIKTVNFGQTGDLPVAGDWNADGIDTPGVYRASTGQFLLTNSTATNPNVEITVTFGIGEDLPVAGDWNADGFDSVGVFRPSLGQFFLTDDNVLNPNIDQTIFFGISGDLPVGGDWDGNGTDTVGVWRASTAEFFLSNDNININRQFTFGAITTDQPIAGDWDGKPNP